MKTLSRSMHPPDRFKYLLAGFALFKAGGCFAFIPRTALAAP